MFDDAGESTDEETRQSETSIASNGDSSSLSEKDAEECRSPQTSQPAVATMTEVFCTQQIWLLVAVIVIGLLPGMGTLNIQTLLYSKVLKVSDAQAAMYNGVAIFLLLGSRVLVGIALDRVGQAVVLLAVFAFEIVFGVLFCFAIVHCTNQSNCAETSPVFFIALLWLSVLMPFSAVFTAWGPLTGAYMGPRYLRLGMVICVSAISVASILGNLVAAIIIGSVSKATSQLLGNIILACICGLIGLLPSFRLWQLRNQAAS
jgi:MFS family permease